MKFLRTKKSKVLMTCLAVILIASILCVSLVGCKKHPVAATALGVYFVGDFQSDVDANTLKSITKEGKTIVSVNQALTAAGIDKDADPTKVAAAIYAVAVTNYDNITQTGYYITTDAQVNAYGTSLGNIQVGIRSTYSYIHGSKGNFSQTVSGVTELTGRGIDSVGDKLKSAFGYNVQSFDCDKFSASRHGDNGGAQFFGADNADVYKYILGGYSKSLNKTVKGKKVGITPANKSEADPELPEYVQTATQYDSNSTLKGVDLPTFNKDRKAWEPLNRMPARIWEKKNNKITGKVIEDSATVAGTKYCYGTYGAGFAVYDFSRPWYLDENTKVEYDETLDLWTIEVAVKPEYVNQACEFAASDLVKSTKDYIGLKNAKYTEISCKFEVYGDGLIKSMQKRDVLGSTEKCPLLVLNGAFGNCKKGGVTSNTATIAFSYSNDDTNAERYAALYWPELGKASFFKDNKQDTSLALNLSSYTTFSKYKPKVNEKLLNAFRDIFSTKPSSGDVSGETTSEK